MFFHQNAITSNAADVADSERIYSISVKTWAGQATEDDQIPFFCLGNDGADDQDITVYTSNPILQLSLNKRNWSAGLDVPVKAGATSDAIFVRATADLDAIENDNIGIIFADTEKLTVHFFIAESNEGDTGKSQAYRFTGDNTREIAQFFAESGESLRVIEYTPLPKPQGKPSGVIKMSDLRMRNDVTEWCNPNNHRIGYRPREWFCKAFVGDSDNQLFAKFQNHLGLNLGFIQQNTIILPADFQGFNPTWRKDIVPFGNVSPLVTGLQGTVWTVFRDNDEYAIKNITRRGFFKGQILFWSGDLIKIHRAGGETNESYLPWNEIIDVDWKVISYVPGHSLDSFAEEYNPYVLLGSDQS